MALGEVEEDEAIELQLGPAARARHFRAQATALAMEAQSTDLPRLREKLSQAAERFIELAEAEECVATRSAKLNAGEQRDPSDHALGPLLAFLRGGPTT